MNSTPTLVFSGGHHTSALLVAGRLIESGTKIIWLGHRTSMWRDRSDSAEYREVTAAGIPFIDLHAGKFYRTINPLKLVRLPYGFFQAFVILLSLKLKLKSDFKGIVSFGGYLAVPVVFCAWLLRIPSVTHEQTLTTGWANRFISLFVKKIALSWPSSQAHYPAGKTTVTGLPIREDFSTLKLTPTTPKTIYITGGKQGSHVINMTVFSTLPQLLAHYRIIHQTGNNSKTLDFESAKKIRENLPDQDRLNYTVCDYLLGPEVLNAYKTSSVVVGRAGAHTIYELAAVGLPCVLIPIPWSSHNEQLKNSNFLVSQNQAILLPQSELTPVKLLSSIDSALKLKPKAIKIETGSLDKFIQLIKQELI